MSRSEVALGGSLTAVTLIGIVTSPRSTVRVGRPDDEAIRTAVVGVGCVNDFSATTRPIEASVGGRRYTRHIECVSLPIAYVQRAILHERVFLEHERGGRDDRRAVPWRGVAAAAGSEQ